MEATVSPTDLNCSGVYLIHFDMPYKHAKHYVGYSDNIAERLANHRKGCGARLMEVIKEAGIGWDVACIWQGATRNDERSLKNKKNTPRLCPVCQAAIKEHTMEELEMSSSSVQTEYTDEELADMEARYGIAPDAEWLDWSEAMNRQERQALQVRLAAMTPQEYSVWNDAQDEEAGLRYDACGGWSRSNQLILDAFDRD